MNTTSPADLAPLSDEAIDRMESAIFEQITAPTKKKSVRDAHDANRHGRRRGWVTGLGVAAAFVIGAVVSPVLIQNNSFDAASSGSFADSPSFFMTRNDMASEQAAADGAGALSDAPMNTGEAARDIIASGSTSLRVGSVKSAADQVTALVLERGGYVESLEIGGGERYPVDDSTTTASPSRAESDYGWISVRVPSDALTETMNELSQIGTVLSSSVNKTDVTSTTVDLRARAEALRASVARLTDLMTQAGSVGDLIQAESALSERQAELESIEQQLTMFEDQVSMSSLSVQLTRTQAVTQADPAGFSDGLRTGWSGLIATMNALVIALGFLIPWLVVLGVAGLVAWLLVRRVRRGRRTRAPGSSVSGTEASGDDRADID